MKFYDGNDAVGEPVCTAAGASYDVLSCSSTGRYFSILFVSNGNNQYAGFDLMVEVVDDKDYDISFGECLGGSMTASYESAKLGTEIILTAKPEELYLLSDLSIVDGNNKNIDYTRGWLGDNTVKYK